MWRSVFLAIGVTWCILGLECFVVDEAVFSDSLLVVADARQLQTAEWMPWIFLGAGAVVILYSINIPKRFQVKAKT